MSDLLPDDLVARAVDLGRTDKPDPAWRPADTLQIIAQLENQKIGIWGGAVFERKLDLPLDWYDTWDVLAKDWAKPWDEFVHTSCERARTCIEKGAESRKDLLCTFHCIFEEGYRRFRENGRNYAYPPIWQRLLMGLFMYVTGAIGWLIMAVAPLALFTSLFGSSGFGMRRLTLLGWLLAAELAGYVAGILLAPLWSFRINSALYVAAGIGFLIGVSGVMGGEAWLLSIGLVCAAKCSACCTFFADGLDTMRKKGRVEIWWVVGYLAEVIIVITSLLWVDCFAWVP